MAAAANLDEFWEVQLMFFVLVLLYTYSRSECPCPKAFTGPEAWRTEPEAAPPAQPRASRTPEYVQM